MGLLLLGAVAFVTMGVWLIPRSPVVAGTTIFFFGLCAVVFAITLHPKSAFLTVASEGFTFASLFRKHFVAWSSVESFAPARIGLNKVVGWNYTPEAHAHAKLRKLNVAISGTEAAFPDTYGMTTENLSALLNEVRQNHGKSAF
jgi:hypothetical protein